MNYGGLDEEYTHPAHSKIVVIPVPYDETSTWLKGADRGPTAILEASANMEIYNIDTDSEIFKHGIYTADTVSEKGSIEKMLQSVYETVKYYLERKKFIVLIGGEHSVSIGAFKAFSEKFSDLTILQLDAHADLRDEYLGSKYNHACTMARAKEYCPIVQVGIRSMSVEEKNNLDTKKIFWAKEIYNNKAWINRAIKQLSKNVYITIDLDVFDPSIMSSTGTPEPGGLLWYDVLDFLKMVNKKVNIVGFDVVELCPNDTNKSPDFLAAKLIYQILSYKFSSPVPLC